MKPAAYRYRWKIDGEWTNWRVADASQKHSSLKDFEEQPLYAAPTESDHLLEKHALDRALQALDEISNSHIPDCPAHYAGDELSWAQRHVATLRRMASAASGGIEAALASPAAPSPAVRKLEWVERIGVAGTFDASTSIGHFIATITDDNRGMWFIVGQTTSNYTAPDMNLIKAAAQAEYEARIRAALAQPATAGEP